MTDPFKFTNPNVTGTADPMYPNWGGGLDGRTQEPKQLPLFDLHEEQSYNSISERFRQERD